MTNRRRLLLTLCALAVVTSCSPGRHSAALPPDPDADSRPTTLLVMGGSATEGDGLDDRLRDAWPYVIFREAFPRNTTFVNAASDNATVHRALTTQLPLARDAKPETIAIWLGADDALQAVPIATFTDELRQLVTGVRAAGARRVLIAGLPPAYGRAAARYDRAVRQVAAATGAEFVDLAPAHVARRAVDGLPDEPDAASHRAIATAFEEELRKP